jgi:hypothetical protein
MRPFSLQIFQGFPYEQETLILVNNFFAWITAEAVKQHPCIVDKYIGDEIMLVFSKEFGSEYPFLDALSTARWMSERDALSFCPHMGIGSGRVVIGYVGAASKFNCSVFGKAVTVASRCTAIRTRGPFSSSIVFPATEWKYGNLESVFPKVVYEGFGKKTEMSLSWKMLQTRKEILKGIGDLEIIEIVNRLLHRPGLSVDERAKEYYKLIVSKQNRNENENF